MSRWSLKAKFMGGALVLTLLPVMVVTAVNYWETQCLKDKINQAKQTDIQGLEEVELALKRQLSVLAVVSGVTALLSGAIIVALANRVLGSFFKAYQTSTTLVTRLLREEAQDVHKIRQHELGSLETNLNLIAQQLPSLLWKQEAADAPFQVLMKITRHIWESFSEENVFRVTVEQLRQALRTDRVVIFRFDVDWEGTFVAESVAPMWPKTLWATIKDPCFFDKDYSKLYRDGRIHVNNDIYNVGLSDCHIGLLERFAVKASIIAPIIRNNQLFGLLIAHQCSSSRNWLQPEIDLFAQIATQVGFALDHTRLLQQIDISAEQVQLFTDITLRLRESLKEDDIFKITVEEVRNALRADRVIVYNFDELNAVPAVPRQEKVDSDWSGTVTAESILPGFPKTLWTQFPDSCFSENYIELYQAGHIRALDNIYEAGLTHCYLEQLESFAVKAYLVAPILKDNKLFGLLIAHQCSAPRTWKQPEIDLFVQIATQVGFALHQARFLAAVEQAHQTAQLVGRQQRSLQDAFERQVSETIGESQAALHTLSTEALKQMESVSASYHQIRAGADFVQGMSAMMSQQTERLSHIVESFHESINQLLDNISTIQNTLIQTVDKFNSLDKPARKISEIVSGISHIVSQIKLQTLSAELESSRGDEASSELFSITQKTGFLAQNLEGELVQIIPLIAKIQEQTYEIATLMKTELQQLNIETLSVEETRRLSHQMINVNEQISKLIEELAQAAIKDVQTSHSVNQSILETVNFIRQTSEQSMVLAQSFNKLAVAIKE